MNVMRFVHVPGKIPNISGPYLKKKDYHHLMRVAPVVCVDMVVTDGRKFLLVKRKNEPKKGQWFLPGGRLVKNESFVEAVKRKLFEETGLRAKKPELIGLAEHFRVDGYLEDDFAHVITLVFKTTVSINQKIKLDSQSSDARWFDKIPKNLYSYPKQSLRLLGFK
ncbi:MAG: NUDIX domain-containing protein [Anaplasmataceae bacterium]|nr:NUDIX domain-containing protein [Anaplasmataceae bacterium]